MSPLVTELVTQANISPLVSFMQQQEAEAKRREFESRESFRSGLRVNEGLVLDQVKRARDQEDAFRTRAIQHYSDLLADAQIAENGVDPAARDLVLDAITAALPGNRDLNRAWVELEADSTVRAAQDERTVAAEIAERSGIRVSRPVAKSIVAGKAVVDQFSGIPIRAPAAADRQKVASAGAAMDALARAKAVAQRIAAGNKGGGFAGEAMVSPTARYFGVSREDPDLNEYSAARDQLGEMLTYALTGAQAAQQQIERILGFMPKVTELSRDPKTGGLTPNAIKRIESAYRLTAALLAAGSMADPKATREAILRAFNERVESYAAGGGVVSGSSSSAPVVRDPRLPPIARPR